MKKRYLFLSFLLLVLELIIAQTGGFIRHTFGDFLAVILLYCLIKSIFQMTASLAIIISLSIAFGIELLQLTSLSEHAIFNRIPALKLILGSTFSWGDLIAYTLGAAITLFIEKKLKYE